MIALSLLHCGSRNPTGVTDLEDSSTDSKKYQGDLVIELPSNVKMPFIWIEPGSYMMGSDDPKYQTYYPKREVIITKGFYLSKYEVTQAQWFSLVGTQPWIDVVDTIGAEFPATYVRETDFTKELNEFTRDTRYRIPTSAEWEYACRAGTTTLWSFGDTPSALKDYAWYNENSDRRPHEVGTKLPNPWGLYDMHGNAYERCADYHDYSSYPQGPLIDPHGGDPPYRPSGLTPDYVRRGGSYFFPMATTTSGWRATLPNPPIDVGFRVLREGPKETDQ